MPTSDDDEILAGLPIVTADPWAEPELYYRQRVARFNAAKAAGINLVTVPAAVHPDVVAAFNAPQTPAGEA
jgi:hypothetical protein